MLSSLDDAIRNETMKIIEKINNRILDIIFPSFEPITIHIELFKKSYKYQLRIIERILNEKKWKYELKEFDIYNYPYECYYDKDDNLMKLRHLSVEKKKDIIAFDLTVFVNKNEFSYIFE